VQLPRVSFLVIDGERGSGKSSA